MQTSTRSESSKRRAINLTIREDIISEAKDLKLNASKAAEYGLVIAIKEARALQWQEQNRTAISTYNEEIDRRGLLLKPGWLEE